MVSDNGEVTWNEWCGNKGVSRLLTLLTDCAKSSFQVQTDRMSEWLNAGAASWTRADTKPTSAYLMECGASSLPSACRLYLHSKRLARTDIV